MPLGTVDRTLEADQRFDDRVIEEVLCFVVDQQLCWIHGHSPVRRLPTRYRATPASAGRSSCVRSTTRAKRRNFSATGATTRRAPVSAADHSGSWAARSVHRRQARSGWSSWDSQLACASPAINCAVGYSTRMNQTVAPFRLPTRVPCPFCELAAGHRETRHIVDATDATLTSTQDSSKSANFSSFRTDMRRRFWIWPMMKPSKS